jgi:hypothetical protein
MRQLHADMYRSTSTIVECTNFYMYLMPLDLKVFVFLKFHRSECHSELDLARSTASICSARKQYAGRGFFQKTGSNMPFKRGSVPPRCTLGSAVLPEFFSEERLELKSLKT